MKAKLTDALISKTKVGPGERVEIFDTQIPGFGVRVGSRERAFFFIRRVNGRKVRMSLGAYPAISLAKARSVALSVLDRIKAGEDPTAELRRRDTKSTNGVDNSFLSAAERFLSQYCRGKKTPLRARTTEEYERHLTRGEAAAWKNRPISSINEKDIISVIDTLEGRGQFAAARSFKSYLRKFFGWCVERHLVTHNPAIAPPLSSKPSDFIRERVLSTEELRLILSAADGLEPPYRAFVYVLVLCGQRRHETSVLQWTDLDLEGEKPIWRIAGEITKNRRNHDVPLPSTVVAIVNSLPRYALGEGAKTADRAAPVYVFSGDGRKPVSGFSKLKKRVDLAIEIKRKSLKPNSGPIAHWTWHDLRRSTATGMANLGVPPHVIEAVLNHVSGSKAGVAGIYNLGRYDPERRKALEMWASHLLGARVAGKKDEGAT